MSNVLRHRFGRGPAPKGTTRGAVVLALVANFVLWGIIIGVGVVVWRS